MMEQEYWKWIQELKQKIRSAQLSASLAVSAEMILLYWDIGKSIVEKQAQFAWGSKIVEQMAKDLKREISDSNGYSRTNLFAMRKFYLFYSNLPVDQASTQAEYFESQANSIIHQTGGQISSNETSIVHQAGGQLDPNSILCKIPWRHHVAILTHCTTASEAFFYLQHTLQHNWSRNILEMQMASNLAERQGKAITNFDTTLPKPQSDLARETLKDPYKFDFLTLEANIQELQFENKLTENITQFLLELGKGFAFVGRQYPIQVSKKERKIDLLFYHLKMHCYVVIDLKMGEFEPEFAGKMNYYLSAVDETLKTEVDQPSIGIILCKSKDNIEVEFALRDLNKPMGISEFSFKELPLDIQRNMPTVEEIEHELKHFDNE
jgi:predicted nuclease of restriction endonuclease-like (RecB) superfamily